MGVYIDQKERGYDSAGKAAYVAADAANESDKDEQIRVLTAAVSSLKSTLMKKNLSAASGSKKFTGNCLRSTLHLLALARMSYVNPPVLLLLLLIPYLATSSPHRICLRTLMCP